MCMICMILSPNCCSMTIFQYSMSRCYLAACLSVLSKHVASQSKWQSADLDLVKLARKRRSLWPAPFRDNLCIQSVNCTVDSKLVRHNTGNF